MQMKTFKSFLDEAGPNAKPKAKGEADFVAAHDVEITDKEDQATDGSAKVVTKDGSGKRKADRLDNKQAMGEEVEDLEELDKKTMASYIKKRTKQLPNIAVNYQMAPDEYAGMAKKYLNKTMKGINRAATKLAKEEVAIGEDAGQADARKTTPSSKETQQKVFDKHKERMKQLAKEEVKKTYRQMMKEADFTKAQTRMAHTIGKEFEKKGVGDEDKGGPYAVASAMVRDKPEAAKKAYATIKSKMKEDQDAELLFKLYNDLNEENQEMFMEQLEEDADTLLFFAKNLMED
jgi:hypothetical protein